MSTSRFLRASMLVLVCLSILTPMLAQEGIRSRHFQTSDGVRLHYVEAGAGKTLVLVPGWSMPADIWEHQLRHFAKTHRVIALDPRGQGRSERPAHGYQPARRALDISELLEHLGGEPAVLAGWSIATQEVLLLTHEEGTENVRAVVLVDHPLNIEEPDRFTSRFINLQTNREQYTRQFIEAIHRAPQSDEYIERMTQAALSMPTNAAAIMIANIILMGPTDLRPMFEALDRPALCIYSSLDWAVAAAEEVRNGWPEVPVTVIDGTSHALFVDKPEEFNLALEEFLATLD
jgi:non-heme chloroperoxidase